LQIRRRTAATRQRNLLTELAMVNERLESGNDQAYKSRQRLEYLRKRRKNWQLIYETITETDAAATLELIEQVHTVP
jgi:chlorophyllide a oxygenase